MRIGYHRLAGGVGVSTVEKGTRGLWWDKRMALWDVLKSRDHEIVIQSRITKESSDLLEQKADEEVDVLMLEFGGTNRLFYGADINAAISAAERFQGPVIYLVDDPDLFPQWQWFKNCNFKNWTVWNNSPDTECDKNRPEGVRSLDLPFGSIIYYKHYISKWTIDKLAYIGRPVGRKDALLALECLREVIAIYGKSKEWTPYEKWSVAGPAPAQPQRGAFYADHLGCLALADKKHKRLKWRTGRIYHAFAGGSPVIIERNHSYFKDLDLCTYDSAEELLDIIERWSNSPETRQAAYEQVRDFVESELDFVISTLESCGL